MTHVELTGNTTTTSANPTRTFLLGYLGSHCPNGDSTHVHPVTIQTNAELISSEMPISADVPTRPCPDC